MATTRKMTDCWQHANQFIFSTINAPTKQQHKGNSFENLFQQFVKCVGDVFKFDVFGSILKSQAKATCSWDPEQRMTLTARM